jgi:uncharacterized protein (DUF2062 family)
LKFKIREVLEQQLKQGVTPDRLALACAVGGALSVFPVLGTTTVLCATAGYWLRLNQPVLHTLNILMAPGQLILLPVYLRMGEWVTTSAPIAFNPKILMEEFFADPLLFVHNYGWATAHGVLAWVILTPFPCWLLYLVLKKLLIRWKVGIL